MGNKVTLFSVGNRHFLIQFEKNSEKVEYAEVNDEIYFCNTSETKLEKEQRGDFTFCQNNERKTITMRYFEEGKSVEHFPVGSQEISKLKGVYNSTYTPELIKSSPSNQVTLLSDGAQHFLI